MDAPMSLAGYAMPGHGIAPAEQLLGLPGFWPAFYAPVWDEFADEPEIFGADSADVDEAAAVLYGAQEVWPAFRIPMAGGHMLWIVHRNFPDDSGTDYLIAHPDWDRHAYLASIEGHYSGPGLSWPELVAVAESAPAGAQGVVDPGLRLLLLLPAFGDADVPEAEAVDRISGALRAVGVPAKAAPDVAERLLDHDFWDGPTWTTQGRSPLSGTAAEPRPLPLCDGRYNPRTVPLGSGITADQERALADALAGGPRAG
ncbi:MULTISPECIES: hypothetical protein [unclassified Streptomyces]|uniref:hypothetical protein n=1 Tax=unclassified Streptomyces TaxID=2593676 RepID=UPI0023650077|nr:MULTISPECIES: hypothetical protein [unclassified Streptomyces]MDF3141931.1 hypothetical protein [Streptomyces sp. T21Q-yed]WDF36922.1 hypothetical protein PBV52_09115 [Streptomyces sp. T12]